jgi:polyhydroxybutyrate depolymerase
MWWYFPVSLVALLPVRALSAAEPLRLQAEVDGRTRQWLVYAPSTAKTAPTPVVFAFHGHGGNMHNAARVFKLHEHWPEAIIIYPQGLPTATRRDPQGERAGWSVRDVTFVDEMLRRLKADYQVDERRCYCTGHSNGGGFTYILWGLRPQLWAAVAPSAANPQAERVGRLQPLPAMHLAGEQDQIVPFADQQKTIEAVRQRNGCAAEGKPWEKYCTVYESKTGTPLVALIHPGNHQFPSSAVPTLVKFFKQHTRSAAAAPK